MQELLNQLRSLGANPGHARHVLRHWVLARPQDSGRRRLEDFLPRRVRDALPEFLAHLDALAQVREMHPAADGSSRLLVGLHDAAAIESVLLPPHGVCVSTQVGCAVACRFCMTGRGGLQRQLRSAEIVAQVALARRMRTVRKVVFMGMGEPAHNLHAVREAIEFLGTEGEIPHKELVFSTVGDVRVFETLAAGKVKPALALSLHSTDAARREWLLPKAPRMTPEELVARGETYARATSYPIQYQWTLLQGVNDGDDEVEGIARLLAGKYAIMNLIPFNAVEGTQFSRPSQERSLAMLRALSARGVLTRLRRSAGQDVDAGCGQLRARAAVLTAPAASRYTPIRPASPAG